jgi:hypothetical protein
VAVRWTGFFGSSFGKLSKNVSENSYNFLHDIYGRIAGVRRLLRVYAECVLTT